jgi:hypothetical protein
LLWLDCVLLLYLVLRSTVALLTLLVLIRCVQVCISYRLLFPSLISVYEVHFLWKRLLMEQVLSRLIRLVHMDMVNMVSTCNPNQS